MSIISTDTLTSLLNKSELDDLGLSSQQNEAIADLLKRIDQGVSGFSIDELENVITTLRDLLLSQPRLQQEPESFLMPPKSQSTDKLFCRLISKAVEKKALSQSLNSDEFDNELYFSQLFFGKDQYNKLPETFRNYLTDLLKYPSYIQLTRVLEKNKTVDIPLINLALTNAYLENQHFSQIPLFDMMRNIGERHASRPDVKIIRQDNAASFPKATTNSAMKSISPGITGCMVAIASDLDGNQWMFHIGPQTAEMSDIFNNVPDLRNKVISLVVYNKNSSYNDFINELSERSVTIVSQKDKKLQPGANDVCYMPKDGFFIDKPQNNNEDFFVHTNLYMGLASEYDPPFYRNLYEDPFLQAISTGNKELFNVLIGSVNLDNYDNPSPAMLAIYFDRLDMLQIIKNIKPDCLERFTIDGHSPAALCSSKQMWDFVCGVVNFEKHSPVSGGNILHHIMINSLHKIADKTFNIDIIADIVKKHPEYLEEKDSSKKTPGELAKIMGVDLQALLNEHREKKSSAITRHGLFANSGAAAASASVNAIDTDADVKKYTPSLKGK